LGNARRTRGTRRWSAPLAMGCALAVGFGSVGLRAGAFLADTLNPALEGRDITVTGVVAAMPQRNEAGLRFRFDVESAEERGVGAAMGRAAIGSAKPVKLPPSIYLGWYSGVFGAMAAPADLQRQPEDVRAGERWQMTVRLKAPHGGSNPHGFDYELWLWEQGLQATGYVRAGAKDATAQRLAQTWLHPVEVARQRVRDAIFERVPDRKLAGVIAALVVGDQNAIERADWDVFRATGVAHLMSISGLHVTMFAWGAALGVGWLWRRSERLCLAVPAQSAGLVGGVLLASAYALFSGWGVPAQRTILMLATVGLLRLSGKRWPWPLVWMLACAVVVALDPWALMQAGFWLSFVAVGVLFATDSGANYVDRTLARSVNDGDLAAQASAHAFAGGLPTAQGRAGRTVMGLGVTLMASMREQWVITLALTPLTLLLFGQVSVVGLVANALAIPWVTLLVTPLAMLGIFFAPIWYTAAWAVQALAWYLQLLVTLPFASISIAQAPLWAGAAGLLGGILLAMRFPWQVRALGLPLLLPVLFWQAPRPAVGHFELLAADIGQGNAVIVRTATHALIYDAGPRFSRESDAGHRVVVPLLRALDLKVDTVMLSHRDVDHTGGAVAVLAMQPQAALVSSIEDAHELQAVRKATRCVAGQRWQWDGVDFEVLHPQVADYDAGNKSNAMSCVLRIGNRAHSALLAGDIEQPQEAALVEAGAKLKSDVLLVPHHGSKTSSSAAFLDAVQPQIALVQAGYRNRFGHPVTSVMDRYTERKITVIDSAHCGAATWQSSHPQEIKCQRAEALRYWHHRVPP
jgi:competence protein ComEC